MAINPGMVQDMRRQRLQHLTQQRFDVLVIGGGITGAGAAWQLARYPLKVALVERRDFASGTSSRSSKLIHGGLRYLPHGQIGLVRQISRERTHLSTLMPHLIHPLAFSLPVFQGDPYSMTMLSTGVWFYDHLGRVPKALRRHRIDRGEISARLPGIRQDALRGGISYWEYSGFDARITWSVIETAESLGAVTLNYCQAQLESAERDGDGVTVPIVDVIGRQSGSIRARLVINATGIWDPPASLNAPPLARSRGIHLVFPHQRLPLLSATTLPNQAMSNLFAIPRGNVTYVGTSDTGDEGDRDRPDIPDQEVGALLTAVNGVFPDAMLKTRDIIAAWSGMRPLLADPDQLASDRLSRRDVIVEGDRFLAILGGKFTGFRATARTVAERALSKLGFSPATTARNESIASAAPLAPSRLEQWSQWMGLSASTIRSLWERYGMDTEDVLRHAQEQAHGLEPIATGLPFLAGEISWAVVREQAQHLTDVIIRRTGLAWLSGAPPDVLGKVLERSADIMAPWLDWSRDQVQAEVASCRLEAYLPEVMRFRSQNS